MINQLEKQPDLLSVRAKETWEQILSFDASIDGEVQALDQKLGTVLRKHEYEYMTAYNVYVKRKEKELLEKVMELKNNSNSEIKDQKIQKLEMTVAKLRRECQEQDKVKDQLRGQIKNWRQKYEFEKQEHEFYHNNAMEEKRKNKLLKVAVGRLQNEYDNLKEKYQIADSELQFVNQLQRQIERVQRGDAEQDGETFSMTKLNDGMESRSMKGKQEDDKPTSSLILPDVSVKDPLVESRVISTGHKSVASSRNNLKQARSTTHKRAVSNAAGAGSRYKQGMIPTENLKFNQFLEILFNSQMTQDEIQNETRDYVSVLETNYTEKISKLRSELDRLKKRVTQERTKTVVN